MLISSSTSCEYSHCVGWGIFTTENLIGSEKHDYWLLIWAILSTPIKTGDQKQLWSGSTVKQCLTDRFASSWQLLEGGLQLQRAALTDVTPSGVTCTQGLSQARLHGPSIPPEPGQYRTAPAFQVCRRSAQPGCSPFLWCMLIVTPINNLCPTVCLSIRCSGESQL